MPKSKKSSTEFSSPRHEAINRIASGVGGINIALRYLHVTEEERRCLKDISARHKAIASDIRKSIKDDRRCVDEVISAIDVKREQESKERHKRSGYTDYVVKVDGSFEGSERH